MDEGFCFRMMKEYPFSCIGSMESPLSVWTFLVYGVCYTSFEFACVCA